MFTMSFASGSKNHGIYSVFWPAPSQNICIYACFTMLQDVVSISERTKIRTVNYNVLGLLLGCVGGVEEGLHNQVTRLAALPFTS